MHAGSDAVTRVDEMGGSRHCPLLSLCLLVPTTATPRVFSPGLSPWMLFMNSSPDRSTGTPAVPMKPRGRLCKCHGEPMEGWRRADGLVHWGCVEKRRTRQQAYMQRRRDDFFFRAEEDLRLRRYRARQRGAARDAERAALIGTTRPSAARTGSAMTSLANSSCTCLIG